MKHVVEHDLEPAQARKAAEKAWESYSERFAEYHPKCTWVTDDRADIQFSVKGMTLKGELELQPKGIALELEVPFLLRPFKKKAIDVIEREIRKWIDAAKAGQI